MLKCKNKTYVIILIIVIANAGRPPTGQGVNLGNKCAEINENNK
jgi:hypothetical protein